MKKKSLLSRLTEYRKTRIPMHMPGHKRNTALLGKKLPYGIDITEVDGFDNLHELEGVLKETAERFAALYGADAAFPLVGGSTCGILSSMHALTNPGDHVLLSRASHKSAFNGVELLSLFPHYLVPETDELGVFGRVPPEQVEEAFLKTPEIKLVVITSPTYEGAVSDIKKIAEICHRNSAYLLVDSAHGAHFGFSDAFPENAVNLGADVVVMSLHKTLPSLTQTALLTVCTDRVDAKKIQNSLSVFESSSPSYVLLSSIDECAHFMSEKGKQKLEILSGDLETFYEKAKKLKALCVFHYDDLSKIIISTKNTSLSGEELAEKLRTTFSIETEMANKNLMLAMATICDKKRHFEKLLAALFAIDKTLSFEESKKICTPLPLPEMISLPCDARKKQGEFVSLKDAIGRECLEYIWNFPPGIPLVCPGERINEELLSVITEATKSSSGKLAENKIYVAK